MEYISCIQIDDLETALGLSIAGFQGIIKGQVSECQIVTWLRQTDDGAGTMAQRLGRRFQ